MEFEPLLHSEGGLPRHVAELHDKAQSMIDKSVRGCYSTYVGVPREHKESNRIAVN